MRAPSGGRTLVALILLAVLLESGAEDLVRVFSLQPDIWAKPRDDVFLRFNLSLQQTASSVTEMTLCHRVFQTALTKLQVFLSYATADDYANVIMMYVIDDNHFFRFNNKPQKPIENIKLPMTLRVWRHYCHVMANGNYTVYVDGEALATGPIEGKDRVLLLNGSFIVGQEQDGLSSKFNSEQILKGYTTQVNLWSYGLQRTDVAHIAACKRQITGDIFSSDREDVELINAGVKDVPLSTLCFLDEKFVVLPEVRNFKDARAMCKLLGSDMFGPQTKEKGAEVSATTAAEDFCGANEHIWFGLTDEDEVGVWRRLSDNKIVTDIYWANGQPDNNTLENCLKVDGVTGSSNDYNCNDPNEKACAVCEEYPQLNLYLRGLCMETVAETTFEVYGYYRKKPYFHSFYGLIIFKDADTQWVLFDTVSNETVALLELPDNSLYPLGKREWVLEVPKCEKAVGTNTELSLSACGSKDYMCANGQCIDLDARCDAKDDCEDETDEDNCSLLGIPEGYRSFKPPKNEENETMALEPEVEFEFIRFLEIDDVLEAIQLEFILQLSWKETRFKYFNLDEDMYANKLSSEDIEQTWRPVIKFPNIKGGDLKMLEENIFVKKLGEELPVDFNAVSMSKKYSGSSAELVQSQRYSGSFNCRFDVFYYPLDEQECDVLVQMASVSKQLVRFTTDRSQVKIDQEADISTYIIDSFTARSNDDKDYRESRLQIKFTLTRRYLLIMLSVFLPSGMLCAVGYLTLFVKLEKLDVRLGVSLTTLLVLYTFFSQTSDSLPKTAYVKMIDVWFFFCTFLLFFIILIHVVVENLEDGKVFYVAPDRGKFMRRPHVTPIGVMVFTRLVAVPLAVLVFSLVYWTMMLV